MGYLGRCSSTVIINAAIKAVVFLNLKFMASTSCFVAMSANSNTTQMMSEQQICTVRDNLFFNLLIQAGILSRIVKNRLALTKNRYKSIR